MRTIIYPGTFDPITRGHLDIIERAVRLFHRVIVAVGENPAKTPLFTTRERMDMIRSEVKKTPRVEVCGFSGLLVDFAKKKEAVAVLRGIRTVSDYEYELQMALTNHALGELETVFMTPRPEFQFLSSQLIREVGSLGGDTSAFLTPAVARKLKARFKRGPKGVRK